MGLLEAQLEEVWNALRAQAGQRANALTALVIRNLRGIGDLRVAFPYPVTVLAGPNGCGKSTVLFASACAYRDPDRGARELVPTSLFPNFIDAGNGVLSDEVAPTELVFDYVHRNESYAMVWKRGRSWNRSFRGRKGGKQPERKVYLRTLANLTSPSEVRSLLQLARKPFETTPVSPELLILAHRVLPRRYRDLSVISARARDLLFARLEGAPSDGEAPPSYSEFHMSAGERAILRMSRDVGELEGALVLIDEIEAGLHPYTQQQVMLELQRTALRQRLQIIVASHSPVVLDSVPPEGRIFLDRDPATWEVRRVGPLRDLVQKALYGQTRDRLSILCEDEIGEAVVRGVLDAMSVDLGLRQDDFVIGRDTGKDEFPHYVRMLGRFDKLRDFLMVLDGDARSVGTKIRAAAADQGQNVEPLFLPGDASPEEWVWHRLARDPAEYKRVLHFKELPGRLRDLEQLMNGAVLNQVSPYKQLLAALADDLGIRPTELARKVAGRETFANRDDAARFAIELRERIDAWRRESG